MSGSSFYDQLGEYGTLEAPAPGNVPGGRSGASSWTDGSGRFWLFGGYVYSPKSGYHNDLWVYQLSPTDLLPVASLSAASLSFGPVKVGTTSASQSVTLSNTGASSLYIGGITVTGGAASSFDFAINCGSKLVPRASCSIHGHFAPIATGPLTAAIKIFDNITGSPQTIALSGTGVTIPTTVSLSASSLSFGTVRVGSGSATQTVTLTNTGESALFITGIGVTGANATSFMFGNSCGSTVSAGNSCTIHGHFAPTLTGALTAAITITDSATGSPQSIALIGTGH